MDDARARRIGARARAAHAAGLVALCLGLSGLAPVAAGAATGGAAAPVVASPAVRYAVGSPGMQTAQAIARAHWGVDPCGGQVQLSWTVEASRINARSFWSNPSSAYGAPALNSACRIEFNAAAPFDWDMFCTVVVHEYGHLAGHEHAPDGPDVMSPIYRQPLAACAATPDPSAPVAGSAASRTGGSAASRTGGRAAPVALRERPRARHAKPRRHHDRPRSHRSRAHPRRR